MQWQLIALAAVIAKQRKEKWKIVDSSTHSVAHKLISIILKLNSLTSPNKTETSSQPSFSCLFHFNWRGVFTRLFDIVWHRSNVCTNWVKQWSRIIEREQAHLRTHHIRSQFCTQIDPLSQKFNWYFLHSFSSECFVFSRNDTLRRNISTLYIHTPNGELIANESLVSCDRIIDKIFHRLGKSPFKIVAFIAVAIFSRSKRIELTRGGELEKREKKTWAMLNRLIVLNQLVDVTWKTCNDSDSWLRFLMFWLYIFDIIMS